MMRRLTTRLGLGIALAASVCVLADTAQAGPFRNRRAAYSYTNACCGGTYGAAYGSSYGTMGGYSYAQPMYSPSATVGYASGCCPQSTYGSTMVYGSGQGMYYPSMGYGRSMYYPSGIQPAGGYYYPGGQPGIYQAGGVPLTMPSPLPTQPGSTTGTTTSDAARPEATVSISITDGTFDPSSKEVPVGTTVKWTNNGKKPHTVTSDKNDWGSNELAPGQTFTATFTKAGTFDYHCTLHKDMKATITVK